MKCERIRQLMSAYIDNEMNEVDKIKFEKHIATCPQCKEEYELLKDIVNECSDVNEVELPENFREELHNMLLKAEGRKSRRFSDFIRKNRWQTIAGSAVAAVLIFAIAYNGLNPLKSKEDVAQSTEPNMGARKGNYIISTDLAPPTVTMTPSAGENNKIEVTYSESVAVADGNRNMQSFGAVAPSTNAARKIIKNGNIALTVLELQSRINEITAMAEQLGGYVENSYVEDIAEPVVITIPETEKAKEKTTKVGSITIKVPADKFDSTFQSIIAMGTIVSQSTNSNDITKQYMDMESRLSNLKIQEKTYQDLLSKAQNVDEILRVETELNRIRTDIDIMLGDLKRWDEQVEYSTIYINLTEKKEAELEKVDTSSVWNRAKQGLISTINSMKNGIAWLFVFLVSVLPYILILGIGSVLAIYFIKKRKK